MKKYKRFPFSIGELPTSYKMSMTYEEQLIWLCNYMEKTIIPYLQELDKKIAEWDDTIEELNKKLDLIDDLIAEFNELKIEFEVFKNNIIKEINDRINDIEEQIIDTLNTEINKIYIYMYGIEERLNYKLDNITIDNFKMVDPTTGQLSSISSIINKLFDQLRDDPINCTEFDGLELTATEFDNKEITAYDFDNSGKAILMN